MKVTTQCGFLSLVCLAGVVFSRGLPFPVPSNVMSMLILFALLASQVLKPAQIRETTDVLLGNMALFFIPSGVGILAHIGELRSNAAALIAICLVTTLMTFAASAFTVLSVVRLQRRLRAKRAGQV